MIRAFVTEMLPRLPARPVIAAPAAAAATSLLLEAVAAIDRLVAARLKWNARLTTAG
jgi:hypothetical protein